MERLSLDKTLKRRLLIGISMTILITMIIFTGIRYEQLMDLVKTSMKVSANEVQSIYIDSILGDWSITKFSASRFINGFKTKNATIQIYNIKDMLVVSSGAYIKITSNEGFQRLKVLNKDVLVYHQVLKNVSNKDVGIVKLISDVSLLNRILLFEILILLLILLAIGTLIYLTVTLFVKNMLLRLSRLKDVSQGFANRTFSKRAQTVPYDEIGELGEVMNFMAKSWQDYQINHSEYISQTAHDFKTPLTVIMTWVDYLKTTPSELNEGLDYIQGEADKLKHLANSLVYAYKSNEELLFYTYVNLSIFIKHAMEKWQHTLLRHQCDVTYNLQSIDIEIDQNKIDQVLFNLVDNVIKHTPVGTNITIISLVKAGDCKIIFKDDGGSNQDFVDTSSGHGIGLKSVYKIIQSHKGTIEHFKNELGGMSIVIELPLKNIVE